MIQLRSTSLAVGGLFLAAMAAPAQSARSVVTAPVANMYSSPTKDTDVVSQAIYGTTVDVLRQANGWDNVRTTDDGYTGWVPRSDLLPEPAGTAAYASTGKIAVVQELAAHLYRDPDLTLHAPILTVPFETHLEIVQEKPGGRWLLARLPGGSTAWIQQGDVTLYPDAASLPKGVMTVPQMVAFSRRFLGLPYTWGGRSSFGYDCSGFVQMLMRQRGYEIPRDADVQAAWAGFEPVTIAHLRAGDVLFFGHDGKITHTGMYIGKGKFIHATVSDHPVIQISRLDEHWRQLLVAQRRVKQ